MKIRRLVPTATVLAVLAAPAAALGAGCPPRSWVAGSVDVCQGALVYNDYVDDDYGADTGSRTTSHTADLAPTAGDQGYPQDQEATADLVRLTLSIDGNTLKVHALLNALYKPDETTLAVAIDSDGNKLTGGGKWGPLDVTSAGWDQMKLFDTGDPGSNTIDGPMPLPPGTHWRVQAVSAIRSSGQVMNVAFRGTDEDPGFRGNDATTVADPSKGSWFEDKQA